MLTPAVHTSRRSRWNPSAVDASIAHALRTMRGTSRTVPVLHEGEVVGLTRSARDGSTRGSSRSHGRCGRGSRYQDLDTQMRRGNDLPRVLLEGATPRLGCDVVDQFWCCQNQPAAGTYTGSANVLQQFNNTTAGALRLDQITPGAGQTRHVVGWRTTMPEASTILLSGVVYNRVATYRSVLDHNVNDHLQQHAGAAALRRCRTGGAARQCKRGYRHGHGRDHFEPLNADVH